MERWKTLAPVVLGMSDKIHKNPGRLYKIYSPVVKSISELGKSIGQAITVVKNWNLNRAMFHHRILWHLQSIIGYYGIFDLCSQP